jgi:bisphosphoglycerate-independent phosphoglycerate mutase (AlkP superfamily)
MDTIAKDHSYRTLLASGTSVGLSEGLMGNSEVGYVQINLQLGFLGIAFGLPHHGP